MTSTSCTAEAGAQIAGRSDPLTSARPRAAGSVTVKVVFALACEITDRAVPPCACAIALTTDSPSPRVCGRCAGRVRRMRYSFAYHGDVALRDVIKELGRRSGLEISHYRPLGRRRAKRLDLERIATVLDVGANVGQYARELRAFGY